jgi:hypothetical protein
MKAWQKAGLVTRRGNVITVTDSASKANIDVPRTCCDCPGRCCFLFDQGHGGAVPCRIVGRGCHGVRDGSGQARDRRMAHPAMASGSPGLAHLPSLCSSPTVPSLMQLAFLEVRVFAAWVAGGSMFKLYKSTFSIPRVFGQSLLNLIRGASCLRRREITMFEMRIIIQLLALLLFTTTVYAQIIPSNRVPTWQPGVTNNGGIPNRTTIYKTLSPSGGDDTPAISAASPNWSRRTSANAEGAADVCASTSDAPTEKRKPRGRRC